MLLCSFYLQTPSPAAVVSASLQTTSLSRTSPNIIDIHNLLFDGFALLSVGLRRQCYDVLFRLVTILTRGDPQGMSLSVLVGTLKNYAPEMTLKFASVLDELTFYEIIPVNKAKALILKFDKIFELSPIQVTVWYILFINYIKRLTTKVYVYVSYLPF